MKSKRAVLTSFGVLAVSAVFAASAFACTIFRGTFTVLGNGSPTSVTSTGLRTSMAQRLTPGIAKATASAGTVTISTGKDSYGVALPAGGYQVNYYNGSGYTNHTNWTSDCMTGDSGRKIGSVSVGADGTLGGVHSFSLGTSTKNTAPAESEVCISNSFGTYGNQAPLTII